MTATCRKCVTGSLACVHLTDSGSMDFPVEMAKDTATMADVPLSKVNVKCTGVKVSKKQPTNICLYTDRRRGQSEQS